MSWFFPAIPGPENTHVLFLRSGFAPALPSWGIGDISSQERREGIQTQEVLPWFPRFIWAHFHRLPALSSAPGSLPQCYHLLYLLKVHKSLVSKLGKWLSPRAAAKAAKGSEVRRCWIPDHSALEHPNCTKNVPGDLPPSDCAGTDPWSSKYQSEWKSRLGKREKTRPEIQTSILPCTLAQALLEEEGREWQSSCWKGAGSRAWRVSDL